MFAEADTSTKQEFLEVIPFVFARRKRIAKPLGLEKIESAPDDCARMRIGRPPRLCKLADPRANRRGHLERTLSFARLQLLARHFQRRSHFVASRFHDLTRAPEVIAGGEVCTGGSRNWSIQGKHPVLAVRLDRDPLANGVATAKFLRWMRHRRLIVPGAPFHSVALRHDEPAPVKRCRSWNVAVGKFDPQCYRPRGSKSFDTPGRKPIRK